MARSLSSLFADRFVPEPIGTPGFDLPDIDSLRRIDFTNLVSIANISLEGKTEPGLNFALIAEDFKPQIPVRIKLSAITRGALLVIGEGSKVFGQLRFNGSGHTVIFSGADEVPTAQTIEMNGTGNCFFLGKGSSSNGLTSHVVGENIVVSIGEDLLSAHHVRILTSDMHGLIDTVTGDFINPAQSVQIGPHVWLAEDSTVLKGSKMGFGSVLGLGSILTRDIPPRCIAAGIPAKVVRENTTWLTHGGADQRLRNMLKSLEERTGM